MPYRHTPPLRKKCEADNLFVVASQGPTSPPDAAVVAADGDDEDGIMAPAEVDQAVSEVRS